MGSDRDLRFLSACANLTISAMRMWVQLEMSFRFRASQRFGKITHGGVNSASSAGSPVVNFVVSLAFFQFRARSSEGLFQFEDFQEGHEVRIQNKTTVSLL